MLVFENAKSFSGKWNRVHANDERGHADGESEMVKLK